MAPGAHSPAPQRPPAQSAAAGAAVERVRGERDLAAVEGVAVAVGVPGVARDLAGARDAGGGGVERAAGVAAGPAVAHVAFDVCLSQPFAEARPSQSAWPRSHASEHLPAAHDGVACWSPQTLPQNPQLSTSLDVSPQSSPPPPAPSLPRQRPNARIELVNASQRA